MNGTCVCDEFLYSVLAFIYDQKTDGGTGYKQTDINKYKSKNWKERSNNRADWNKSSNLLKKKHNLLYIRNQSVPRSKHFTALL